MIMSFAKYITTPLTVSLLSCLLLSSCDVDWRSRKQIEEENKEQMEHEQTLRELEATRRSVEASKALEKQKAAELAAKRAAEEAETPGLYSIQGQEICIADSAQWRYLGKPQSHLR